MTKIPPAALKVALMVLTILSSLPPRSAVGREGSRVIAVVLGKQITVAQKGQLSDLIIGPLFERFAKDHKIQATEKELAIFTARIREDEKREVREWKGERKKLIAHLKNPNLAQSARKKAELDLRNIERSLKNSPDDASLTESERQAVIRGEREIARGFVMTWKINKALYAKYGGRVIFQQGGPEPLDAYRKFLQEEQGHGAFQILDKEYEPAFWEYFTNDSMHMFYPKKVGAKFMKRPWWLVKEPAE